MVAATMPQIKIGPGAPDGLPGVCKRANPGYSWGKAIWRLQANSVTHDLLQLVCCDDALHDAYANPYFPRDLKNSEPISALSFEWPLPPSRPLGDGPSPCLELVCGAGRH
jgi:hypothetical protein